MSALVVAGKETAEIVHRAGRALALLHDELRDAEPSAAFRSVRRKLLLPPGPVGAVRAVRSVVDFTPYNMLVDDSGILSIIDVEPVRPSVSLHSDLAWILGWYGEYGGKEPEAFLSGYERQTGRAFDRDDERLLATFLTRFHAFRARVQLRRRNWSAAAEAFAAGRREWSRAL